MRKSPIGSSIVLLVLFVVQGLGNKAYGMNIQRTLEDRTKRKYSIGSVYTVLSRLLARGALTSKWSGTYAMRGGRRRRYYRLTAGSRAELNRALNTLLAVSSGNQR